MTGLGAGDIEVHPLSDGAFVVRPRYFGDDVPDDARPDVFDREGAAWAPIGCFLLRSGDRTVLVDAGLGPARWRRTSVPGSGCSRSLSAAGGGSGRCRPRRGRPASARTSRSCARAW